MEKNKKVVFIIPGHGGKDSGATGNNLVEKEINLKVALHLEEILSGYDVEVIMSRKNDVYISPAQTSEMAKEINPDICWSIHHNFFGDSNPRGAEVIDGLESVDDKFSNTYLDEMEKIGMPKRKRFSKANKNGSEWYWAIRELKDSDTYAIISEGGFLSNLEDAKLLKMDSFLKQEANAIATSIINNLKLDKKNVNYNKIDAILSLYNSLNCSIDEISEATKKYVNMNNIDEEIGDIQNNIILGKVNVNSLNVRNQGNINGDIITVLKKDDIVNILEKESAWYKVETSTKKIGYVHGNYINIVGDKERVITTRKYGSTVYIIIGENNEDMIPITGTYGVLEKLTDMCKIDSEKGIDIKYATNETYFQPGTSIESFGTLMIRYPHQEIAGFYKSPSPDFTNFIKYKDGTKEFKRYIKNEELNTIQGKCDYAINAATSLVINGERFLDNTKFPGIDGKHPRTAKGYLKDGRPFMIAVEGRRTNERGITANELSNLCLELGAEFAWISDGGGSSEMVKNNKGNFEVINKPTDGIERKIGIGMAIIIKK